MHQLRGIIKLPRAMVVIAAAIAMSIACGDDSGPPNLGDESVTTPFRPQGEAAPAPGEAVTYSTGGATSNLGNPVDYRFRLEVNGTQTYTDWSPADTTVTVWPDSGLFGIAAQARSRTNPAVESQWSPIKPILANVGPPGLPHVCFGVQTNGMWHPYTPGSIDTVGMYSPFTVTYHGETDFGDITAYRYVPLSAGTIPGAYEWHRDLSDTARVFTNSGNESLPAGTFRMGVQCRDEAWGESVIDVARFEEGVAQVRVNFDPETTLLRVVNIYDNGSALVEREIDFTDGVPDTVPYNSHVRLEYFGRDDPRDLHQCDPQDPDECIAFQVMYRRTNHLVPGSSAQSGWLPRGGTHDTDPNSTQDANTFRIGSLEYEILARAIDEQQTPDGTPASVDIVGNFDPVIDSLVVVDHLGNRLNLAAHDTLTWNFWKGEGWPYDSALDTLDVSGTEFQYYKSFYWVLNAYGHDHPMDPPGSGVKAWKYDFTEVGGGVVSFARSGNWVDGAGVDVLSDTMRVTFYYPGPGPNEDPAGDTVFANLPAWLNTDYDATVIGRDTGVGTSFFEQTVTINGVEQLVNVYPDASLGRRTAEGAFRFHFRLIR